MWSCLGAKAADRIATPGAECTASYWRPLSTTQRAPLDSRCWKFYPLRRVLS